VTADQQSQPRVAMLELLSFISYLITLYTWVVIASVIMSWLISFNVINLYNPVVRAIWDALGAVTEPLLRPIRRFTQRILPDLRGIDISPIFLLLGCMFVQSVVLPNIAKIVV
jgi:YggT family protein